MKPDITASSDSATSIYSYVMRDPPSRACIVADPVFDYDSAAGRTNHTSAEHLITHVRRHDLQVEWLLEIYTHADHLPMAISLQRKLGERLAISARTTQVQAEFSGLLNLGEAFPVDGRRFEHLFEGDELFHIGTLECHALYTLRRTPAYMIYPAGDSAFVDDTLFIPDYGIVRCDFPGDNARQLYCSIQRLFALPDVTRLFIYHDYTAPGRDKHRCKTNVGEQRRHNMYVREGVDEETFVAMHQQRDIILGMSTLMLPTVQVNICGGNLSPVEGNGVRYLRIPPDLSRSAAAMQQEDEE